VIAAFSPAVDGAAFLVTPCVGLVGAGLPLLAAVAWLRDLAPYEDDAWRDEPSPHAWPCPPAAA